MKKEIEAALSKIIGLPLASMGRAADMEWLGFGELISIPARKGGTRQVAQYALHIQCAWHIVKGDEVIVGSRDLYYPADGSRDMPSELDEGGYQETRRDVRTQALLQAHESAPLVVTAVEAGQAGFARIFFTEDYVLEIFPDDSFQDEFCEHWRFFKTGSDDDHFVVTGNGIE